MNRSTPPPPPPMPASWQRRLARRAQRHTTIVIWFRLIIPGAAGFAAGAITMAVLER